MSLIEIISVYCFLSILKREPSKSLLDQILKAFMENEQITKYLPCIGRSRITALCVNKETVDNIFSQLDFVLFFNEIDKY